MADETPLSIHHPEAVAVGGVVVIQEIFGVTEHIEDVCQRLAHAGWLAVAPHLFWRSGDPILATDDYGTALEHTGKLAADSIMTDVDAALAYIGDAGSLRRRGRRRLLRRRHHRLVATRRPIGAAVSYYGGGILESRFGFAPMAEAAPGLEVPWLGLYGGPGPQHPSDQVEQLAARRPRGPRPTPR